MQNNQFYLLLIVCIISLILQCFKSFFQKKGENLATKQDVEEITRIIEEVKTELVNKTEELKSKLYLQGQNRIKIKSAQFDAITNFTKQNAIHFSYLVHFPISDINERNFESFSLDYEILENIKKDKNIAEIQLELLLDISEFAELNHDLSITLIELENFIFKTIRKLKENWRRYNTEKGVIEDPTKIEELYQQFSNLFLEEYGKHNVTFIEKYESLLVSFRKLNHYFYNLIIED